MFVQLELLDELLARFLFGVGDLDKDFDLLFDFEDDFRAGDRDREELLDLLFEELFFA